MQLAKWEHLSFDPPEKKTDAKGNRYRPITLPTGMENWASPDFDAAKAGWKTGQAPFGQNNGEQITEAPGGSYKNGGDPRGAYLFADMAKQISGQEVTLAVKAFLRMNSHANRAAPPTGHLSVWLEEVKLPPAVK